MHSIPAFPGLLRPGSTALFAPHIRNVYGGKDGGVVFMAGNVAALVTYLEDCRPALIPLEELSLDLNETGRLHARMWLEEQGHATIEDRPEVLAWSVESVRRGGKPIAGVAGLWLGGDAAFPHGATWVRVCQGVAVGRVWNPDDHTGDEGSWQAEYGDSRGLAFGNRGMAACDAALLALGWALTNDDGSLTLPPLPEVQNG